MTQWTWTWLTTLLAETDALGNMGMMTTAWRGVCRAARSSGAAALMATRSWMTLVPSASTMAGGERAAWRSAAPHSQAMERPSATVILELLALAAIVMTRCRWRMPHRADATWASAHATSEGAISGRRRTRQTWEVERSAHMKIGCTPWRETMPPSAVTDELQSRQRPSARNKVPSVPARGLGARRWPALRMQQPLPSWRV